jgi:hypothetical protein
MLEAAQTAMKVTLRNSEIRVVCLLIAVEILEWWHETRTHQRASARSPTSRKTTLVVVEDLRPTTPLAEEVKAPHVNNNIILSITDRSTAS